MTLEEQIADALHVADRYEPSPDLFARVQTSIENDAAFRVRAARVAVGLLLLTTVVTGVLVGTRSWTDTTRYMVLEGTTTTLLVLFVVTVGPAIRRFGEAYERRVFAAVPGMGSEVLRLLDIAYYLIFAAYVVITLTFEAPDHPTVFPSAYAQQMARAAGLMAVMGVLHITLVMALPVVGLVASANAWRVRRSHAPEPLAPGRRDLQRLDLAVSIGSWLVVGGAVLFLVLQVIQLVIGVGGL